MSKFKFNIRIYQLQKGFSEIKSGTDKKIRLEKEKTNVIKI